MGRGEGSNQIRAARIQIIYKRMIYFSEALRGLELRRKLGSWEAVEKLGGSVTVPEIVPAADKHKAKHRTAQAARKQAQTQA